MQAEIRKGEGIEPRNSEHGKDDAFEDGGSQKGHLAKRAWGGSFPGVDDLGMHDIVSTRQLGRSCTCFSEGEYA